MKDLKRIDSLQLYKFWQQFAMSLLLTLAMFAFAKILPPITSPVLALVVAVIIYKTMMVKPGKHVICGLIPYGFFISLVAYALVSVAVNIIGVLHIFPIEDEMLFNAGPGYVPSLIFLPVALAVFVYIRLRLNKLSFCNACHIRNADVVDASRMHDVIQPETRWQLSNLIWMFLILTALVYGYFFKFYVHININSKDWYVFSWMVCMVFGLDIVYMAYRYYNLYLDLKEQGEVITPEELMSMTARTYLRYYVICGDYVYVNPHTIDADAAFKEIIDTPFFTRRNINGITHAEVKAIISKMTGVSDGELRFFYGRNMGEAAGNNLLRYFYFLDGTHEDHEHLRTDGEWYDFKRIKQIYSTNPSKLARLMVVDITRMSTIMITSKLFSPDGIRKNAIKAYCPSFNLNEVRDSDIDFQSEQWVQVAIFNSDKPFFKLRRWWRRLMGRTF